MARPRRNDWMHRDPASWYGSIGWQRRSKQQLMAHPICAECASRGYITPATTVDHVENVRAAGTREAMWMRFKTGAVQSLCRRCHEEKTDRETGRQLRPPRPFPKLAFGPDGSPISDQEWRENHGHSVVSRLIS